MLTVAAGEVGVILASFTCKTICCSLCRFRCAWPDLDSVETTTSKLLNRERNNMDAV